MKQEQIENEKMSSRIGNIKVRSRSNPISQTPMRDDLNVVWALDPNEANGRHLEKMGEIIRLWNPHEKNFFPLSILSPLDMGWPMEITPKLRKELLARARSRSCKQFSVLPYRRDCAEILISPKISLLSSVRKMLQYASRKKAEMIFLYSRQSEERRITGFGSFSELTIASSKIPVMVVGKQTRVPRQFSKILYPTDFSPHRRRSFQKTMEWAKRFDAELILFHQLSPLTPVTVIPIDAALARAAWEAQKERDRQNAEKWVQEAERNGVSCRVALGLSTSTWTKSTLDAIHKEKVDLVVISHRRGVWGQTLFGGNIRRLFSKSTCPLVLIHSP
jgi:nucleotide-binding universal stress UspA family protein